MEAPSDAVASAAFHRISAAEATDAAAALMLVRGADSRGNKAARWKRARVIMELRTPRLPEGEVVSIGALVGALASER